MEIKLNKERKITLLQALQKGELNPVDVCKWFAESADIMSDADLMFELDTIKRAFSADLRKRIKQLAVCATCAPYAVNNGSNVDLSLLSDDELKELLKILDAADPTKQAHTLPNKSDK